jgi:predicted ArsR family transcriptional regulator
MQAPGLGESQQQVIELLKRGGPSTVPRLAALLRLNVETLRSHLKALAAHGLVERRPGRRGRRGRPEVVFGLTPAADALFPSREGEILRGLAEFLQQTGNADLLARYLEGYIADRRDAALARVRGLAGRERMEETARILSELGFMAEVAAAGADAAPLHLCHCPLRNLVDATRLPCRLEQDFITELLGESLTRRTWIPAGDASCSYTTERAAAAGHLVQLGERYGDERREQNR